MKGLIVICLMVMSFLAAQCDSYYLRRQNDAADTADLVDYIRTLEAEEILMNILDDDSFVIIQPQHVGRPRKF